MLERLADQAELGCRMHDLAGCHLSQSALSRVVGRLENDGLVKRSMCANDRRGIFANLTDEGRARTRLPARRTARCSSASSARTFATAASTLSEPITTSGASGRSRTGCPRR